ncbi:ABM domain-containing protein [Frankia sp. AiPs1]
MKADKAAEVEAAVKSLFVALEEARPEGIRYTSLRLADGVTYEVLLQIEEGVENPLPKVPEFLRFQENLKGWLAEPPTPEQATVIGDYQA